MIDVKQKRTKSSLVLCLLAVGLLAIGSASAANPVDETKAAAPNGSIEIGLISGELTVVGWDRQEIRVRGDLGAGDPEFRFEVQEGEAEIEIEPREDRSMGPGLDLEISIPRGSQLEIAGVSVDISISGIRGATEVETVSGEVEVRDAPSELEIEGVSGDIEVYGDVPIEDLEVEVVSGSVLVDAPIASDASIDLASVSGELTFKVPADISAQFDVETFSGGIESAFGGAPKKASRFTPAQELSFTLGGGGASIDLQSFSGRVRIVER
jgi:DUF4097 and DUF4098 domain-containing protein YvlB